MANILLEYTIDYSLSSKIDFNLLLSYTILPLKNEELYVVVATSNIDQDIDNIIEIFKKPVKLLKVEANNLNNELQYHDFKVSLYNLANQALESIHTNTENSYIIKFIDTLFSFSIAKNVSDIHFESLGESVLIRLRIDGELNQVFRYNCNLFALISSIIKYFGNLDIAQRRIPLNGRFSRKIGSQIYDMRISTMPTIYGESVVLRILDNGNIQKNLQEIGFDKYTLETITTAIKLNQGLILVTGPTGSGKTTSLYSMLSSLNTKNKKIITIEDPVEYKLDGVMQVNINNDIDLDYGTVLKNILRQDPDILMIGEIRDKESLQIAIQASLTGHLVISTLHTNSSLDTITRLLDLDAESYLIASTLKMVLSQRLLRRLCENCKIKDTETNGYLLVGCKECNFTGYKNRKVVSEVLYLDEVIVKMISQNKSLHKIEEYIKKQGFLSLEENALKMVSNGDTTLEEFYSKI